MSPKVGILMGSDSDLEIMEEVAKACEEFGVGYAMHVCSAHRTPHDAAEYARTAHERGLKMLIAGAGAAAHLAGVLAAFTPLPVIAILVKSKVLKGLDSLLSMMQMPAGVPVATAAIDGGRNAGLLAVQILATADAGVAGALLGVQRKTCRIHSGKRPKVAGAPQRQKGVRS